MTGGTKREKSGTECGLGGAGGLELGLEMGRAVLQPSGDEGRVQRKRASRYSRNALHSTDVPRYFRLVSWSQSVAPPPPIAAPIRAPFLPPTAAPTPAPAPADDPMMMALLATDRVFRTGRSS